MDERFMHDVGMELTNLSKITISYYKKFSKVAVSDENISVCGLEILTSLRYYPDKNTVSDLAEQVEVSKGLISREVETLRQKGFVTTSVDPNDRRILRVSVAKGADKLIKKQKKKLFSLIYQMAGDMTDEEIITFRKLVNKLIDNSANVDISKEADISFDMDKFF